MCRKLATKAADRSRGGSDRSSRSSRRPQPTMTPGLRRPLRDGARTVRRTQRVHRTNGLQSRATESAIVRCRPLPSPSGSDFMRINADTTRLAGILRSNLLPYSMIHTPWRDGSQRLGRSRPPSGTSPTVFRGDIGRCRPRAVSGRVTDTVSTLCPRMPAGSRFRARDRQSFWTMTEALRPLRHRRAEKSKPALRQPFPASADAIPFAGIPPGRWAALASRRGQPPARCDDDRASSAPPQRHRSSCQVRKAEGAVRSRLRHPAVGDGEIDSTAASLGVKFELVGFTK